MLWLRYDYHVLMLFLFLIIAINCMISGQSSQASITNCLTTSSSAALALPLSSTLSFLTSLPLNLIIIQPLTCHFAPTCALSTLIETTPGCCWLRRLNSDLKLLMLFRYASFYRKSSLSLALLAMGSTLSLRTSAGKSIGLSMVLSIARDFFLRFSSYMSQIQGKLMQIFLSIFMEANTRPIFLFFATKLSCSCCFTLPNQKSTQATTSKPPSPPERSMKLSLHAIDWQRQVSSVWGALISLKYDSTFIEWMSFPQVSKDLSATDGQRMFLSLPQLSKLLFLVDSCEGMLLRKAWSSSISSYYSTELCAAPQPLYSKSSTSKMSSNYSLSPLRLLWLSNSSATNLPSTFLRNSSLTFLVLLSPSSNFPHIFLRMPADKVATLSLGTMSMTMRVNSASDNFCNLAASALFSSEVLSQFQSLSISGLYFWMRAWMTDAMLIKYCSITKSPVYNLTV